MLYKVKLELARSREFPQGNSECRYELVLLLTEDHGLDLQAWRQRLHGNGARRYWRGGEARGELKHDREGWFLTFGYGVARDEAFFQSDDHRFAVGEPNSDYRIRRTNEDIPCAGGRAARRTEGRS